MKLKTSIHKAAAAVLIVGLASVLMAATVYFRIRDYPIALTLTDTNIFEVAAAGVTNYQVSFGTLATNLAKRFGEIGSIGVGTTNPARSLHVIGSGILSERTNADPQLVLRSSGVVAQDWNFRVEGNTANGAFAIRDVSTSQDVFKLHRGIASHLLNLGTNGFGIGARLPNPAAWLHVMPPAGWATTPLLRIGTNDTGHGLTMNTNGFVGIGLTNASVSLEVTGAVKVASLTIPGSIAASSFTTGWGGHLFSDGTNLCVVVERVGGTRTTNKISMVAWP